MPAKFMKCTKTPGSRTRTIRVSGGRYIHVCRLPSGHWTRGEVKKKKQKRQRQRKRKKRRTRKYGK